MKKYHVDPAADNEEPAFFGTERFIRDNDGVSNYKATDSTGYITVSDQERNTFRIYPREGAEGNPHHHPDFEEWPVSAVQTDVLHPAFVAFDLESVNSLRVELQRRNLGQSDRPQFIQRLTPLVNLQPY